jgi:hypothetical protein
MELSNLKRGQIAVISKVKPGELYLILIERGFYPGNKIEFLFSDIFQDMKIFRLEINLFSFFFN